MKLIESYGSFSAYMHFVEKLHNYHVTSFETTWSDILYGIYYALTQVVIMFGPIH